MKENEVRYVYLRRQHTSRNHGGVVTCAATLIDPNTLNVGFSFCSPKDEFVKKVGRNKAAGRMLSHHASTVPFHGNTYRDIVNFWNTPENGLERPQFCHNWMIESTTGEIFEN